jgi:LTXXQ motif family protein
MEQSMLLKGSNGTAMRWTQNVSAAFALISLVATAGAAAARYNGRHDSDVRQPSIGSVAEPTHPPVRSGPLGVIMTQLMNDCEQQAVELRNFPADEIAGAVTLDDSQADALKKAHSAADEAANRVAETCPAAVPAIPADRLDMIGREIDGIDAAVKILQPALAELYELLSDDQKAHLVLRFAGLEGRRGGPPETTGSVARGAEDRTRRTKKSSDDHGDTSSSRPTPQALWNCDHWQAELRAWRVERVEQSVAVRPRQRAPLYLLAAAVQQSADALEDSCPQNNSATPVARIRDLKNKLEAVRKSIAIIRPALTGFYEVLDSGQTSGFNDAL